MGLVVTRKEDERVFLKGTLKEGQRISIRIQETGRGRTKLYIEAPDSIEIMREELLDPKEIDDAGS